MPEIIALFSALGLWNWVVAGLVLLALELLVPGVFLLWFGLAALLTAAVSALLGWIFPVFATWQIQLALFIIFSLSLVMLGRYLARREPQRDALFLNRRTDALLGQIATLDERLRDGHGHVRIGDTLWRITGSDLPVHSRVRLVRFCDGAFEVERVD